MVGVAEGTIKYPLSLMKKRVFQSLEEMDKDEVATGRGYLLLEYLWLGFL